MAKKGVVIFDGEDMFINPKKAIYSKTRGEARNASFMSARGDDGPEEAESPIGRERIVPQETTSGGGGGVTQTTQPVAQINETSTNVIQSSSSSEKTTPVESSAPITVFVPKAEVPPILPPNYVAPVPELPQQSTKPTTREDDFLEKRKPDDGSGNRYSGPDNNPGLNTTPIVTVQTTKYVAPVPPLPKPPDAVVIFDPLGGGGSPLLGDNKEVPKVTCPKGFVLNAAGICTPIVVEDDIKKIGTNTTTTTTTKSTSTTETTTTKKGDEILTPATSSTTTTTTKSTSTPDTTTTKAADKVVETSTTTTTTTKKAADKVAETTTSTTTTTTTKKAVKCNPPIYAPPRGTRWKDLGNCTFTTEVDPNFKGSAPVPPLPATPGQPVININLPGGGIGTPPTLPTKPEPQSSGGASGGGGGGGGTPFPEEPAPVVEQAPKKNYFWWYVFGALAVYLLIKRKKSQ